MRILDRTFPTAAENLACDEALLDLCETNEAPETLRLWSPADIFVVLGYSNKIHEETHFKNCQEDGVGIFRRCSGGGTVLQGPGCLNYSLVLKIDGNAGLANIVSTNHFIMERHRAALEELLKKEVKVQGSTDLTTGNLKFSGNSQRRKRNAVLFHGTFLLDFDLRLIERTLAMPSKEPAYRKKRGHSHFLMNLDLSPGKIKKALQKTWDAEEELNAGAPLRAKINELTQSRYLTDEWNLKF